MELKTSKIPSRFFCFGVFYIVFRVRFRLELGCVECGFVKYNYYIYVFSSYHLQKFKGSMLLEEGIWIKRATRSKYPT